MALARSLKELIRKESGFLWIGVAQIVQLLSGFLVLAILTRALTPSSFGYYSLCVTIVMFARQVLYDPVSVVMAKNTLATITVDKRAAIGFWCLRYLTDRAFLIALIAGTVSFLYFNSNGLAFDILIFFCFLYLGANGSFGMYINVLNATRERKYASIFTICDSIGKLVSIGIVVSLFESSVDEVFIGISLAAVAVVFVLRGFISNSFNLSKAGDHGNWRFVERTVVSSLPLIIPSSLMALKMYGDRWIIAGFMGVEELAAYSVLLQLGYLPMILAVGVVQTYVVPTIYNLGEVGDPSVLLDYLKYVLIKIVFFTLAIAIVSAPLAGLFFELMVGAAYLQYSHFLPLFVISGGGTAISSILYVALVARFSTEKVAKMASAAVFLSLVCTAILVAAIGFLGSVVVLLASSVVIGFFYWRLLSAPTVNG